MENILPPSWLHKITPQRRGVWVLTSSLLSFFLLGTPANPQLALRLCLIARASSRT